MSSRRRQHGVALPLGARAPDPKTVGGREVSPLSARPPGPFSQQPEPAACPVPAPRPGALSTSLHASEHSAGPFCSKPLTQVPGPPLRPLPGLGGTWGLPAGSLWLWGLFLPLSPALRTRARPVPSLSPPLSEQRSRW